MSNSWTRMKEDKRNRSYNKKICIHSFAIFPRFHTEVHTFINHPVWDTEQDFFTSTMLKLVVVSSEAYDIKFCLCIFQV